MESHNQEIKIDMKLSKYKILIKELTNEIHSLEEPQSQELILELAKELAKNLSQEINAELTVEFSELSKHLAKEINKELVKLCAKKLVEKFIEENEPSWQQYGLWAKRGILG